MLLNVERANFYSIKLYWLLGGLLCICRTTQIQNIVIIILMKITTKEYYAILSFNILIIFFVIFHTL